MTSVLLAPEFGMFRSVPVVHLTQSVPPCHQCW